MCQFAYSETGISASWKYREAFVENGRSLHSDLIRNSRGRWTDDGFQFGSKIVNRKGTFDVTIKQKDTTYDKEDTLTNLTTKIIKARMIIL